MALQAAARNGLAGGGVGGGQHGAPVGQGFRLFGGGGAGAFLDHAFHDIAGLGGLFGLIDIFADRLDHENEDQAAQDGADDLVPLEGIHAGKLPKTGPGGSGGIRGDITRPAFGVIAA